MPTCAQGPHGAANGHLTHQRQYDYRRSRTCGWGLSSKSSSLWGPSLRDSDRDNERERERERERDSEPSPPSAPSPSSAMPSMSSAKPCGIDTAA